MINLVGKKYFLFDLDGTLVDLEQLNFSCFRVATQEIAHIELTFEDYSKHMAGVGSVRGFESYFATKGIGNVSIENLL